MLNDEVLSIDIPRKSVMTRSTGRVPFDYLVIALGVQYSPETVPGFPEHADKVYDLASSLKFKEAVETFQGGAVAIGISRLPFMCPAAPYEVAIPSQYSQVDVAEYLASLGDIVVRAFYIRI